MTCQMKKYRKNIPEEEKNGICSGNLIRLLQTEFSCGYLCADFNYNGDYSEGYIREYKGEYETEKTSVESIWEIEGIQETEENYGKLCKIENNEEPEKF